MSGGWTGAVMAVAAVVGAGVSYTNGQAQQAAAKDSQRQARTAAEKQAAQADESMNRQNRKSPNTSAILDAASQAGKAGVAGTTLTGPQGVDPSALTLGKNTLLGA